MDFDAEARVVAARVAAAAGKPHMDFDAEARVVAARVAAAAGKPHTREEGLRAIHAVLHRHSFESDRAAWVTSGASRRLFFEWKPLVTKPLDQWLHAPDDAAPVPQPWSRADDPAAEYVRTDVPEEEWPANVLEAHERWEAALPRSTRKKDQILLVHSAWFKQHVPNLMIDDELSSGANKLHADPSSFTGYSYVSVGEPMLSPDLRHFTRRYALSPPTTTSHTSSTLPTTVAGYRSTPS